MSHQTFQEEGPVRAHSISMKTVFLYAREADTDRAGRRFKLGVAQLRGLELIRTGILERSYASLNDLCSAITSAVESPVERDIARLRREVPSNFDFVMMVTEAEARRLGFPPR